ncbi:MAG: MBL fold metallo-hydrolase [Candidatus Eisenbacteria bacterium]|nr:MBL fold metallo-hydrolase [Candidatus Eisenbacteria bacterium]
MPAWTDLGSGIRVRQSRAFAMNSVLLADREHAVLVDPGVLPAELDDLAAAVRGSGAREVALLFTHAHWDHVVGRAWWPGARTLGHHRLAAELLRDADAIRRAAAACAAGCGASWTRGFEPFAPDVPLAGGDAATLGPWRLEFHEAPGHCDSQLATLLPGHRVLIAADMLSDLEIPWLDRPPAVYRATLEKLRPLVEAGAAATLVPGHGAIARGDEVRARLACDLAYLDALEQGVRDARAARLGPDQAQARLAAMDYTGKGAAMDEVHRANVRLAWEAAG